jgi:hypothetical protein
MSASDGTDSRIGRLVNITSTHTYQITLFIAGDLALAKQILSRFCYEHGLCVTVTPTCFIYPGGEEAGLTVGLVNYPRYPDDKHILWATAEAIAKLLLPGLNQRSCLLVAPDTTQRMVVEPPGAKHSPDPA